ANAVPHKKNIEIIRLKAIRCCFFKRHSFFLALDRDPPAFSICSSPFVIMPIGPGVVQKFEKGVYQSVLLVTTIN
ncbi:MAG TPA: hypothetical protein VN300_11660, partial [Desulfobacterales bacterium]|nr:hypothetical protein [Desulfobacterales bacterium]